MATLNRNGLLVELSLAATMYHFHGLLPAVVFLIAVVAIVARIDASKI